MNLHFGVCGIGFGHASRSAALLKTLRERGYSLSVSSYGDGLTYLRRAGFDVKPVPPVGYGVLPEGKVSIKMTIFRNMLLPIRIAEQTAYEMSYIDEVEAEAVVSDTRGSTVLAAKLLGKPVLTLLNQFNIRIVYPRYRRIIEAAEGVAYTVSWLWSKSNRLLIADYPPPLTLSSQNLNLPKKLENTVRFIGPIIEKKPEELPSKEELEEKYGVPDNKPIVFFHASGPSYERRILVKKFLKLLPRLAERFRVLATLGGVEAEANPLPEGVRVWRWVEHPLELFKLADVVVCRAGQTTLAKALSYGKPVIMIPIEAHAEQMGNAQSVERQGAGIIIREEELSGERLLEALERIFADEGFRRSAEHYRMVFERLNPLEEAAREVEALK